MKNKNWTKAQRDTFNRTQLITKEEQRGIWNRLSTQDFIRKEKARIQSGITGEAQEDILSRLEQESRTYKTDDTGCPF